MLQVNSLPCLGNESKLIHKSIVSHYLLVKTVQIWLLVRIFRTVIAVVFSLFHSRETFSKGLLQKFFNCLLNFSAVALQT